MNLLKLYQMLDGKVSYLYQPEGRGDFGEIVFDLSSKKAIIARKSSADTENGRYANKAISKIEDFVEKKNLPMEYTQAWY